MNEHTAYQPKGQVSGTIRCVSGAMLSICSITTPRLHTKMDRRLVHTFLDLLPVIVMHRHRNHGLLLSELGDICWERNTLRPGCRKPAQHLARLDRIDCGRATARFRRAGTDHRPHPIFGADLR